MKRRYNLLLMLVGLLGSFHFLSAQTTYKATFSNNDKSPSIMLSYENVVGTYLDTLLSVEVASNVDFKVLSKVGWLKVVKFEKNYLYLKAGLNESDVSRVGTVELTDVSGALTKVFTFTQTKSDPVSYLKGDYRVPVSSGVASAFHSGEDISRSFDDDFTTLYHSPWSSGQLPITLTYNFSNVSKIDYVIYTPRPSSSGTNGNFNQIEVSYKLAGGSDYVILGSFNLGGSSSAYKIDFPAGLVNPTNVRFKVLSGSGDLASCAEMQFFRRNDMSSLFGSLFQDGVCSVLKPEVTDAMIATLVNPFVKKLAKSIKSGSYSTEFRVNEFEAFPTLNQTSSWMRTSSYNSFENPTGIYFQAGEQMIIFVDNPGSEQVSLLIRNQTPGESGNSTYPLQNGMNKITAANVGNGYLNYYTTNWASAPKVKVHFALSTVNGYYDLEKYKTSDGSYDKTTAAINWKRLLALAVSPMYDVVSKRHHACYPTAGFRAKCPNAMDGCNFALAYDSIVYREHEIMGLVKYNLEPKNRQYTRSVASGMFADGLGAGIPNATSYSEMEPKSIGWWGIGHELGHVNQVRPAMKWVSISEVSNNIFSSYVEHKVGNSAWIKSIGGAVNYRLEYESFGATTDVMAGAGGRFNCYLNYGIKDGSKWLMTEGPDYYGQALFGTPERRNYDHFVKLCPFWQLTLYFKEAGVRPDFWAQIHQMARTVNTTGMSNGDLLLNFMRTAMDSTKLNLTPFFERVGMLREYNDYLADYSPAWMKITPDQVDELLIYGAKYPALETPVLYYISIHNMNIYRDKLPLSIEYGTDGVTAKNAAFASTGTYANTVRMYHDATSSTQNNVKNVVAFETYDSAGKLLRISMRAFKDKTNKSTYVLYPKGSARIDAVGCDGTRKTVYAVANN